jgi:DNA-binding MarR family transcriptional regulator
LSKVAVTGLVDRVVRAGWVERRLDKRDRRVRRLYLTPTARSAVAAMREKVDVMTAASMGHIADAKGREMVREFEGIKDRLLKLGPGVRRSKSTN